MAVLTPPPATRDISMTSSRIPPVPPLLPYDDGESRGRAPMQRVPLPPDRFKPRLAAALFVSLVVNLVFYNQAAVWGKQVRVVFLRALHQQYVLPPAQIILVAPHSAARPGGKTTYTPLVVPSPVPKSAR